MSDELNTTLELAAWTEEDMRGTNNTAQSICVPRDLLMRLYLCLDWICGEGLGPWPPESAPDPDDLYLELGTIVNSDGVDPRNLRP